MTLRHPWIVALAALLLGRATHICGDADTTCAARGGAVVRWVRTAPVSERATIDRWCAAVGPPAQIAGTPGADALSGGFAVVSWNTHVGAGDLDHLVADLRSGRLTGAPAAQFVLLLQEAYRAGADVPAYGPSRPLLWAALQQPQPRAGVRAEVVASARRLGLFALYVPSMRNGAPAATDEDRGNAILSTVPLSDPIAIELPLERQRRVALQAAVHVRTSAGVDTPLMLVDAHLTNMVLHHVWLLSEAGRTRQAHALASALPTAGPLVIGGDFNAWFGFHDAAYRELAKVARPAQEQDRRATFGPMRLDHLLFRLPDGWRTRLRRADARYESDHYPLAATIDPG
jgi:endonuclease/exonuclease/phosphatase family metal-dependent hydrolase